MKKRKLRGLMDLPKVSKITRPGAVTQIQIFKPQNPSVCPLRLPPFAVAGAALLDERSSAALPRTLGEGRIHLRGTRGCYFSS